MSNAARNVKYLTIAKKYLMSKGIRFETNPPKQKQIRNEYIKLENVDAKFHDKKSFIKFIISECAREGSPIFVQLKPIEINKARNEKRKLQKVAFYQQEQKKLDKYKRELKRKATPAEKKFKEILKRLDIKAMFQKGFMKDRLCIVDFYVKKFKLCIEIDGGYHFERKQQIKDYYRTQYLKGRGMTVVRFTNDEVFEMNDFQIIERLGINYKKHIEQLTKSREQNKS